MTRKFYMDKEIEENYDVENKKGIVYNGIVQKFNLEKGCSAAW